MAEALIIVGLAVAAWLVSRHLDDDDFADEEPITEEEEAWGRDYWQTLAFGDPEPDHSHLRFDRVERIREALEQEWASRARRISGQRRRR